MDEKNLIDRPKRCYKNYTRTSICMVSTIIVEAFKSSLEMYGLIFGGIISDGDSSMHSKILEARPYPNDTEGR